jgi:predicted O-methyltransferase YrrM
MGMWFVDPKIQLVLDEYQARNAREAEILKRISDAEFAPREHEFLLATGPVVGQFLNQLIKSTGAKTILELGMSYGYTSIYLGEAARATGGRVITTEFEPNKIAYARERHVRAGLSDIVEIRVGDVRDTLDTAQERFDIVLLDVWKDLYVDCLERVYPKLAPGGYLIADNMINIREQAFPYRQAVRAKPHIDSVLLPFGHGIEVSRYTAGLDRWFIAPI